MRNWCAAPDHVSIRPWSTPGCGRSMASRFTPWARHKRRLWVILIVGIIVVIGSVLGGYIMEGGEVLVLNQPAEFVVIGGAALGSLLIGTPISVMKALVGQLMGLLKPETSKSDYKELLAMLYQ